MIDRAHAGSTELRWAREWPFVLALAIVGAATRAFVALHPYALSCGDTALFGLMAKHTWTGQAIPVFAFGQHYNGALGAWLMAPAYGVLGADLRGLLLVHVVTWALAVPILYRLLFALGGRWGAVGALVAFGLGTRPAYDMGAMVGYFELIPLAAVLHLALLRASHGGWTDRGALGFGLLIGVGLWINPQFVAPATAAVLALIAASPTRSIVGSSELASRVGRRWATVLRVALVGAGTALVGSVALLASGALRALPALASIGAGHPGRNAVRAAGVTAAVWLATELVVSSRRRAIVLGLAALALTQLPLALCKVLDVYRVHDVPLEISPERVRDNVRDAPGLLAEALGGATGGPAFVAADGAPWCAPGPDAAKVAGVAFLACLAVGPALCGLGALARAAFATLRLRIVRPTLPALLALQALVTLVGALLHPKALQVRYFDLLWLPYMGALAAAIGTLAGRRRAIAAVTIALLAAHHARDFAGPYPIGTAPSVVRESLDAVDLPALYAELEAGMSSRSAVIGYAAYDHAFLGSYLSDERIRLTSYGGWLERVRDYRDEAAACPRPVVVFRRNEAHEMAERDGLLALGEARPGLVVDRWDHGGWSFVQLRRRGWLAVIQGDPPGD